MKKVAFVVQRCGLEVNGGAELHCLQLASRLSSIWQTEILTTRALDYMTWENYYPKGSAAVKGTLIRRFSVDHPRNVEYFNQFSAYVRANPTKLSHKEQEKWMQLQGPLSSELRSYIQNNKDAYDFFIFFTYLYATTYFLLPLVAEKAWLIPTAHDEWPIYLSIWDGFFQKPRGFIFNTPEEKNFLQNRFPDLEFKGRVIGAGIDPPQEISPERFRKKYKLDQPYLLYMGRIDEAKGLKELFEYFRLLRLSETGPRKLVLLGKPVMEIPRHKDIKSPGFVDEQAKWDALGGCEWLVNPSPHESLSFVLLEAWYAARPVLVTAKSAVLVNQCKRADGGLWFADFLEFEHIIKNIGQDIKDKLGRQGQLFCQNTYSWNIVIKKILSTIN